MTPKPLTNFLVRALKNDKGVLLVGSPGLGKTSVAKQAAVIAGMDMVICHSVCEEPTDYRGLPAIVDGEAVFLPYNNLKLMIEADKPLVFFFDDLGQASMSVQKAQMQLFLERALNGVPISDNVLFVGATNKRSDRAGVKGIIQPLLSRFHSIINMDVSVDDWCDWAFKDGLPPELVAFIRFRPELLHKFDPALKDESGNDLINQPMPRTVAHAGEWMQMGEHERKETRYEVFKGCIGEGFTAELFGFLDIFEKLGDMPQRIAKGDDPEPPSDPATLYALCTSLSNRAIQSDDAWSNIVSYARDRLPEEYQLVLIKDAESTHGEAVYNTTEYVQWQCDLSKFLNGDG